MTNQRRAYWRLCVLSAILLSTLTFTPLVIPTGVFTPMLAGLPLTLWAGILIAIGLVGLTFIASRILFAGKEDEE